MRICHEKQTLVFQISEKREKEREEKILKIEKIEDKKIKVRVGEREKTLRKTV